MVDVHEAIATYPGAGVRPRPLGQIIEEGEIEIGPALAQRILDEAAYPRQRPCRRAEVLLWVELLKRGEFEGRRQIWFGRLDQRLILIDGQHRLRGIAESGIPAWFAFAIKTVASAEELHDLYCSFDRVGRIRTTAEMLNAQGVADEHGLQKNVARSAFAAALQIHFRFNPPHPEQDPVAIRDDVVRLAYAERLWPLAAVYQRLVQPAPTRLRSRLLNAQVMAVALVTLFHRRLEAEKFWGAVALNDGLRKGDPAHTLITWLHEEPTMVPLRRRHGVEQRRALADRSGHAAIASSLAWNAHCEKRDITYLKVNATQSIKIIGAPSKGPLI